MEGGLSAFFISPFFCIHTFPISPALLLVLLHLPSSSFSQCVVSFSCSFCSPYLLPLYSPCPLPSLAAVTFAGVLQVLWEWGLLKGRGVQELPAVLCTFVSSAPSHQVAERMHRFQRSVEMLQGWSSSRCRGRSCLGPALCSAVLLRGQTRTEFRDERLDSIKYKPF